MVRRHRPPQRDTSHTATLPDLFWTVVLRVRKRIRRWKKIPFLYPILTNILLAEQDLKLVHKNTHKLQDENTRPFYTHLSHTIPNYGRVESLSQTLPSLDIHTRTRSRVRYLLYFANQQKRVHPFCRAHSKNPRPTSTSVNGPNFSGERGSPPGGNRSIAWRHNFAATVVLPLWHKMGVG